MKLPHKDMRAVGPYIDHPSQARPGIQVFPDRLYVITVISNGARFRKRYELYREFEKHMHESGVTLITVEASFGGREYEITEADNPHHLRLTTHHLQELWLKENMLNLGIQHLSKIDPNWKYVAWIDADVHFSRPDWAQEILHQLQHYHVVQPWSHAYDLDQSDRIMETHQSFSYSFVQQGGSVWDKALNAKFEPADYGYGAHCDAKSSVSANGSNWHPGYAWAARRDFFLTVGGLFDKSGLGAGDFIMALAMIGKAELAYHGFVSAGFKRQTAIWEDRAKHLYQNIGYCDGTIWHKFHGTKADRQYQSRWSYLIKGFDAGLGSTVIDNLAKFDPETDLIPDHQGLYQIPVHKVHLRDDFRKYSRARSEDLFFYP